MATKKKKWWRKVAISIDPLDSFHGGSYPVVLSAPTKKAAERKFEKKDEGLVYYYFEHNLAGPFPNRKRAENMLLSVRSFTTPQLSNSR